MAAKNPKISVEEVEFECNVCLEVPKSSPIFQCQEGHIFCNVCHPKLRQQCPVCGKGNLGNIKCLIAQKILKTTSDSSSLSFSSHLDALVQQDIGRSYDYEQISLQEAMDSIQQRLLALESNLNLSARSHFQPYIATAEEAETASQTRTSQVLTAAVNEAVSDINEAYSGGLSPGGMGIAGGGGPGGRTPARATGGRGTIEMPNIQALGLSSGGWQSGNHPMAGIICDFCQEVFQEFLRKWFS